MKGFTLIEIIVVTAIVLTLSVLSSVFYSRFFLQSSVAMTVDQVVGTLRKAQLNSLASKRADSWSVNYSGNTLTLFKGTAFATRNPAFDETFKVGTNITISGLTTLSYARATGLPSVTPTITISGGGNLKTISINSQGVVSR